MATEWKVQRDTRGVFWLVGNKETPTVSMAAVVYVLRRLHEGDDTIVQLNETVVKKGINKDDQTS